jgi:hypothetical protein
MQRAEYIKKTVLDKPKENITPEGGTALAKKK